MNDPLIAGNAVFRKNIFEPQNLARWVKGQHPKTCWIGCSDSRVPPEIITNSGYDDLFVIRNIANIVSPHDPEAGAVVDYAVNHLKVRRIVICGHYHCGGLTAAWHGHLTDPFIEKWLNHTRAVIHHVREVVKKQNLSEDDALKLLTEEHLRTQKHNILKFPVVADAVEAGRLKVDALIYDITDGSLSRFEC